MSDQAAAISTLPSPFSSRYSDFSSLHCKMRADSFEVLDNEESIVRHASNQGEFNRNPTSTRPTSPYGWVFHSPPSSVSAASPSLLASGIATHDSSIYEAKKPPVPNDCLVMSTEEGNRRSPTFSESQDSFFSQSSETNDCQAADGLPPNSCAFTPEVSDHLLEFVLRLTDTPPDRYHSLLKGDRPRCMTEDSKIHTSQEHRPSLSALLDDLPFSLGQEGISTNNLSPLSQSLDHGVSALTHQFDTPLFCCSASTDTKGVSQNGVHLYANSGPNHNFDATCRSTLSLVSNNGSLTTAASTPSGTPTWCQDLATTTNTRASTTTLLQQPSRDSLLLSNRLLCSPLSCGSSTPKAATDERLSDVDSKDDNQSSTNQNLEYFPTGFLRFVVDCPFGDSDVHLPPVRPISSKSSNEMNGPSVTSSTNRLSAEAGSFHSPLETKSQLTGPTSVGLRHLHSSATNNSSNCFIQATGGQHGEDDAYGRNGTLNGGNCRNFNEGSGGNWEDNRDRRGNGNNNSSNSAGLSKGLTDFYSLAYASKRWQNLNVVLPLYIPHGVIAVIRSTGENTYVFPDQHPSSQLLFSGAGKICDMWATYLRLRVAVIHKCPEFLVPRVAQVFNDVLANLPKFTEPIHLRCAGVVKHTIQLRSSGGLTYRYDTIGQISNSPDQDKMRVLFDGLQKVMSEVNHYLAREVEDVFRSLQARGDLDENDANGIRHGNPKCGLEFRFSPCKELKIAIREGTVCDCSGVDSVIAGGGASSMSAWAQQFIVENLIVGELRLERDKTSETQLDPFFLPHAEIKTRMISKDLDGNPARICFVDPSVYPDFYRPRVEYSIGMAPLQAAEQLIGATHHQLAKLLPNGMNSLTAQSPGLHIPGVTLPQVFTGSSNVSYGVGDRSALSGSLGRQAYNQTCSSSYSPTPCGSSTDQTSWPNLAAPAATEQPYARPLGWSFPQRSETAARELPPVSCDVASDALKGLAVLQKMLSNLSLAQTASETKSNIPDQAPAALAPSVNDVQQINSVIGQAAAAAMALGRQTDSTKTPEACALLSQLQSALQKLPSITQHYSPPESTSPIFVSPKQETTQRSHPHLPFPSVGPNRIMDIESMEDISQTNRSVNESDSTTPHISEEELRLLRGSKSVGATPANYTTSSAFSNSISASPTVSTTFLQMSTGKHDTSHPTPSTTMEGHESTTALNTCANTKNAFEDNGNNKDDKDVNSTSTFCTSRENL